MSFLNSPAGRAHINNNSSERVKPEACLVSTQLCCAIFYLSILVGSSNHSARIFLTAGFRGLYPQGTYTPDLLRTVRNSPGTGVRMKGLDESDLIGVRGSRMRSARCGPETWPEVSSVVGYGSNRATTRPIGHKWKVCSTSNITGRCVTIYLGNRVLVSVETEKCR